LAASGIRIGMDDNRSFYDIIITERLSGCAHDEDVYVKEYSKLAKGPSGIATYIRFYNERRRYQALTYQVPT